jgi:hypothetical protein
MRPTCISVERVLEVHKRIALQIPCVEISQDIDIPDRASSSFERLPKSIPDLARNTQILRSRPLTPTAVNDEVHNYGRCIYTHEGELCLDEQTLKISRPEATSLERQAISWPKQSRQTLNSTSSYGAH